MTGHSEVGPRVALACPLDAGPDYPWLTPQGRSMPAWHLPAGTFRDYPLLGDQAGLIRNSGQLPSGRPPVRNYEWVTSAYG